MSWPTTRRVMHFDRATEEELYRSFLRWYYVPLLAFFTTLPTWPFEPTEALHRFLAVIDRKRSLGRLGAEPGGFHEHVMHQAAKHVASDRRRERRAAPRNLELDPNTSAAAGGSEEAFFVTLLRARFQQLLEELRASHSASPYDAALFEAYCEDLTGRPRGRSDGELASLAQPEKSLAALRTARSELKKKLNALLARRVSSEFRTVHVQAAFDALKSRAP
jgi:hypothetical protein